MGSLEVYYRYGRGLDILGWSQVVVMNEFARWKPWIIALSAAAGQNLIAYWNMLW